MARQKVKLCGVCGFEDTIATVLGPRCEGCMNDYRGSLEVEVSTLRAQLAIATAALEKSRELHIAFRCNSDPHNPSHNTASCRECAFYEQSLRAIKGEGGGKT